MSCSGTCSASTTSPGLKTGRSCPSTWSRSGSSHRVSSTATLRSTFLRPPTHDDEIGFGSCRRREDLRWMPLSPPVTGRIRLTTAGHTGTSATSCPPTGSPAAPGRPAAFDLSRVGLTRADGTPATVGDVLADTFTDAYVVLHDGELVAEWYGPEGAADRPHAVMSVSKSVVGCVAAVLIDRGQLDADRLITDYVPELAASGYADALVRHVLDMSSGVAFVEEYANPHSDVRVLDRWLGWRPDGISEPR